MEDRQHSIVSDVNDGAASSNDNRASCLSETAANTSVSDPDADSDKANRIDKSNEVVGKSHPNIYREDVVKSNKTGAIGIVSEVAGDSDSESDITDDDDEDDDDDDDEGEDEDEDGDDEKENVDEEDDSHVNNKVDGNGEGKKNANDYKCGALDANQVRVLWMDDTEPVQHINDVTVVDRGFLHGDFVASASDPIGQVGVVVDVNISVDLLASDGSIIKDVSSRDLKRVRDFAVGDYVVHGPWLGRIDDILDNVTVLFDDGSVCKVVRAEPLRLRPSPRNTLEEDGHFPYYPGQSVRASSSSVFKNSRWLSGLWKPNRLEGTVTKVTAGSAFVYWIASAGYGLNSSVAPPEEQNPKNLKLLSCFAHANWQVGDWGLLPSAIQPSSIPLHKHISKLQLHDSTKIEADHQLESGGDSEDTQEEANDNVESMNFVPAPAQNGNNETVANKSSPESSSCGTSLSVSKEPVHEHWPLHRKKIRKVVIRKDKKARKKEESFERALMIVNTRTKVDVAWQDGTVEHGRGATSLIPIESPGDHEFVAEQYVVEKASDDDVSATEPRRVGVVKSVNAKERTASVRWLKPVARAEDPKEFAKEEVVSVYELEGHPDYDYCYGDVVVRLSPVLFSLEAASTKDFPEESMQENAMKQDLKKHSRSKTAKDPSENKVDAEMPDLSWVGNITGLKDGDIEVTWADGMVSTVGPQAIYVVGRDDDESVAAGSEVSDAASWETVNDDDEPALENAQEELGLADSTTMDSDAEVGPDSRRNAALALPLAAIGFVTRLASGIFSRGRKNDDCVGSDSRGEDGLQFEQSMNVPEEGGSVHDDPSSQKSGLVDNSGMKSSLGKAEDHINTDASVTSDSDAAEALCSLRNEKSADQTLCETDGSTFKRFDITQDPLDHYFLGTKGQDNKGRKWFKKVQQDWSILQNNLPDGIYVRVYEDRMDLLRAVIVGAYGTPYQDGLFFFDFHLPPEYPDVPPSAYYHSGGWRINPNLYEEGKVCLSLLNTWTGRGNEVWDPASSSILQVLVSLQGLVLNSRPYFNEAGYDKQVGTAEGEKNSLAYNENTFLLNCKTMMHLMRKPPKDFGELIKEHFKRRGYYVLKACDAYMKGYLIGSLTRDASASDESNTNSISIGFKLMLAKIVPKLYTALAEVGADCHEFQHLQQL